MEDVRRLFNSASEVVGDHEDSHPVFHSQLVYQAVELRLDGGVKPRDGFVQKKKMFGRA